MNKSFYRIVAGVLTLLWMSTIFWFSNQPATESGEMSGELCQKIVEDANRVLNLQLNGKEIHQMADKLEYPVRKAAHMTEYAILGLLSFSFYFSGDRRKHCYGKALLTAAFYAATDEFHQYFVPGRSAEIRDVCIDTAGAAIGLFLLYLFWKIIQRHCTKDVNILK